MWPSWKTDVTQLKTDVAELKTDVTQLKTDVGDLKGFALETLLHRRIRPLISQRLGLRRTRVMQSPAQEPVPALTDPVETGADNGVITVGQENRVTETDIIVRAQRQAAPTPVWGIYRSVKQSRRGRYPPGAGDSGYPGCGIRRRIHRGGSGIRH